MLKLGKLWIWNFIFTIILHSCWNMSNICSLKSVLLNCNLLLAHFLARIHPQSVILELPCNKSWLISIIWVQFVTSLLSLHPDDVDQYSCYQPLVFLTQIQFCKVCCDVTRITLWNKTTIFQVGISCILSFEGIVHIVKGMAVCAAIR